MKFGIILTKVHCPLNAEAHLYGGVYEGICIIPFLFWLRVPEARHLPFMAQNFLEGMEEL
jgi:hypothetical protein